MDQLHIDDIVVLKADVSQRAVVHRTHEDVDTHEPYPGRTEEGRIERHHSISRADFKRFMRDGVPPPGTALLEWQEGARISLEPTAGVKPIDRSFLIGDIVKRSVSESMSGVVINTHTKCNLQPMCDVNVQLSPNQASHTFKGMLPAGLDDPRYHMHPNGKAPVLANISAHDLQYAESPTESDVIIYKDWIGSVVAISSHLRVLLSDSCVVEISDEVGERCDGLSGAFYVGDLVKAKKGDLRRGKYIFGRYNPNTPPVGTVVDSRIIAADVLWSHRRVGSPDGQEPPPTLEREELESPAFQVYDRTRYPKSSEQQRDTLSNSTIDARLELRVRFRDLTAAISKYSASSAPIPIPRLDRQDTRGYDLNVFDVTSFQTDVTVQWQDLTLTEEPSINLVPDTNIDDEHAAWPGEIVHSVDLHYVPGLAHIKQPNKVGVVQSVQAAERLAKVRWSENAYIHYSTVDDASGLADPMVSLSIPTTTATEEEWSMYDLDAPGAVNVRRGDIVLVNDPKFNSLSTPPTDATWLGEIVDTPLDGSLTVRLGAARDVQDVKITRECCVVVIRSDGTDAPGEDMAMGGVSDSESVGDDDSEEDDDRTDYEDEDLEATYEDENGEPMDADEVENDDWESEEEDEDQDVEMHNANDTPIPSAVLDTDAAEANCASTSSTAIDSKPDKAPPAYLILEGPVPESHHYCHQPSTSSSSHIKRTQKEHKILGKPSSLPEGVYVRTWESRMDLVRVLLIGPTETPYQHAPFIIDFHLPPEFPIEPPQAFFHSWPAQPSLGSNGRVNPNLYQDGKICLSLLGTWDGERSEAWSPAKSTLLQVIVSILGLVLVREPYFNEAGYEALVGSEASKIPSALYSERISIRAKGFILHALSSLLGDQNEGSLEGFVDVLRWLYLENDGPGFIQATISNVEHILENSPKSGTPDGITSITKGASISMQRVLERLKAYRQGKH